MKGFAYPDLLIASLLTLIALVVGLQLLGNIVTSNHFRFDNVEIATATFSEKLLGTCLDKGGLAYCDTNFIRKGVIDHRALAPFEKSAYLKEYEDENGIKFKVSTTSKITGVYCIVRLVKVFGSNQEEMVIVCAE